MTRPGCLVLVVVAIGAVIPAIARADRPEGVCMEISVDFTPASQLQIVAWLEKPDGAYVDTIYMTQKTARFGLGNRPGRADFNTGSPDADTWPYGRRVQTFPVWAHRHGISFPEVVFQNGEEDNLSHPLAQSSPEMPPPYCRPLQTIEPGWDTGTSASKTYTDKGMLSPTLTSSYPPRADLMRAPNIDTPDVDLYRSLDVFDAISHATPRGGELATAIWAAPQSVDYGDYVLFVETSKTYDFNGTYNENTYPSPPGLPWAEYGLPWRGQPSIVYEVPFSVASTPTKALASSYAGYGDPTGDTGVLNVPDTTITTDTPGSGASRLQLTSSSGDMFRVRVRARPDIDATPPAGLRLVTATDVGNTTATIVWTQSGDDGEMGVASGYDVRIRAGSPITLDNFDDSMPIASRIDLVAEQQLAQTVITGLLPETDYEIGVRAYDNCFNRGPLAVVKIRTLERVGGEVDACFIATAAYGSQMANDVQSLRRFRDAMLTGSVLGQLAVTTYYTFGPAVAGPVGESDLLRATARSLLAPLVRAVRSTAY